MAGGRFDQTGGTVSGNTAPSYPNIFRESGTSSSSSSSGGSYSSGSSSGGSSSSGSSSRTRRSLPKGSSDIGIGFAGSFGADVNWQFDRKLLSIGLPLQLGLELGSDEIAFALLGEAGAGLGFSSSLKYDILLEWNYGGAAEFYFLSRMIGLGFGYGIADSILFLYSGDDFFAPGLFNTTYMRLGLIFRVDASKVTLYGQRYGDGKWGIGLQWAGSWPN